MPRTIAYCVNEARGLLNDETAPFRYTDDLLYLNFSNALLEARHLRPDLFMEFGLAAPPPVYTPADAALPFPVDEVQTPVFALYIAGKAELRDDEFTADGRAALFVNSFYARLKGAA